MPHTHTHALPILLSLSMPSSTPSGSPCLCLLLNYFSTILSILFHSITSALYSPFSFTQILQHYTPHSLSMPSSPPSGSPLSCLLLNHSPLFPCHHPLHLVTHSRVSCLITPALTHTYIFTVPHLQLQQRFSSNGTTYSLCFCTIPTRTSWPCLACRKLQRPFFYRTTYLLTLISHYTQYPQIPSGRALLASAAATLSSPKPFSEERGSGRVSQSATCVFDRVCARGREM